MNDLVLLNVSIFVSSTFSDSIPLLVNETVIFFEIDTILIVVYFIFSDFLRIIIMKMRVTKYSMLTMPHFRNI